MNTNDRKIIPQSPQPIPKEPLRKGYNPPMDPNRRPQPAPPPPPKPSK